MNTEAFQTKRRKAIWGLWLVEYLSIITDTWKEHRCSAGSVFGGWERRFNSEAVEDTPSFIPQPCTNYDTNYHHNTLPTPFSAFFPSLNPIKSS